MTEQQRDNQAAVEARKTKRQADRRLKNARRRGEGYGPPTSPKNPAWGYLPFTYARECVRHLRQKFVAASK